MQLELPPGRGMEQLLVGVLSLSSTAAVCGSLMAFFTLKAWFTYKKRRFIW